jgi:hypothetical protein
MLKKREAHVASLSRTRFALTLLALLSMARVVGQAVARIFEPAMLPPDALWHSATVFSPVLVIAQIAILSAMVIVIRRLDRIQANPRKAKFLLTAGGVYFAAMSLRFVIGATGIAPGSWFDKPISTPFHLVLAGWLLVFAFHLAGEASRARMRAVVRRLSRAVAYPAIMAAACALFFWLRRNGAPVQFSAYLPVTLGASAILILEIAAPYRQAWRPGRRVVAQDALYLLVVQVALPAALTLAIAGAAAGTFGGSVAAGLWPHDWPVVAQAGGRLHALLAAPRGAPVEHAVAAARGSPCARRAVFSQCRQVPPVGKIAPVPVRRRAVHPDRRRAGGGGGLFRVLLGERVFPAFQCRCAPRPAELADFGAGAAPLASLAHRA